MLFANTSDISATIQLPYTYLNINVGFVNRSADTFSSSKNVSERLYNCYLTLSTIKLHLYKDSAQQRQGITLGY